MVYISKVDEKLQGRVANLDGITVVGESERDVLASVVQQFKSAVSEILASKEEIPWIDPPLPKDADEQKRFLPVHL